MANEKRLIDINKVINSMQKCLDGASDKNSVAYLTFEGLIECMKQEPTVDAVEVVQCKNCKHYDGKWHCWRNYKPGMRGADMVDEEDFCSYGERRTK